MSVDVHEVSVAFGGVTALNKVSLQLERGRILAVIGPNGSGKSTLFNSITGMVAAAGGKIAVDGVSIDNMAPNRRIALGLARTFQTPRFDPHITVEEAVLCGFYPVAKPGMLSSLLRSPGVAREEKTFSDRCSEILRELRLTKYRATKMGELPMGQVRLVEVARAVANNPKYILLDEPAAGLARDEQAMLSVEVRRLAETGVGVLLVEHNFNLIRELAEHVIVLNRGAMLMSGRAEDIARDKAFIDVYLGSSGR
ncbi:ABC transporter ATP-binding protein [Tardiphaga sp.]|jgi:branched-chain amino acid transport system ATP-binding protein|uniref:ABC transporter ATP-binding protein n=1 Tax=Tardiphaga sp. TaxID=1926292 RepID=UPI0037D9BEEE